MATPQWPLQPQWPFQRQLTDMPELSTSVASDDSNLLESAITTTSRLDLDASCLDLRLHDSATSQAYGGHMMPIGLEKVVDSTQEKEVIEPLASLSRQLAPSTIEYKLTSDATPRICTPPSNACIQSPAVDSEASTSPKVSEHIVTRGFEPGRVSTSVRSSTNLNRSPVVEKATSFIKEPLLANADVTKSDDRLPVLAGSSEEENGSSFEAYSLAQRSSLTEHLPRAGPMRKTTFFKAEVSTRTYHDVSKSDAAIESDSEDDVDESAIEEEGEDDEEWEDDDNEEIGPSSVVDRPMSPRVDSRANLSSRRSLLTTALHQDDRASALQNAASRSSSAIRLSRTTAPNGPSTGNSPQEDSGLMMRAQTSHPKPIIMTTSNVPPEVMSPKSTRKAMLTHELTNSLRQNLLWERQQTNATTNAVAKRQKSAVNLPALRRAMTTGDVRGLNTNAQQSQIRSTTFRDDNKAISLLNDVFEHGLGDYHRSGW